MNLSIAHPSGLLAWLLAVMCISGKTVLAADLEREKRLAEQISDAIFDGETFYLEADGHQFLSIYMEASEGPAKRAALIIHGRGYHPDWEQVAQPLRIGLTEHGWNTLSIQMPVLDKEAKFYEYLPVFREALPRIDAAIRYLREQGNDEIVMIAHSCGVHMSMAWVREKGSSAIDAYIGVGMGATDYKQPMREPFPFENLQVPVLDLYGSADYPAVQNGAPERWAAIQAQGHAKSRQLMLMDADHYMRDQNEALLEAVSEWLDTVFATP